MLEVANLFGIEMKLCYNLTNIKDAGRLIYMEGWMNTQLKNRWINKELDEQIDEQLDGQIDR